MARKPTLIDEMELRASARMRALSEMTARDTGSLAYRRFKPIAGSHFQVLASRFVF
jgi:hypothetical protein